MTELPKSLKEIKEQTEKLLGSGGKDSDDAAQLNLVDLSKKEEGARSDVDEKRGGGSTSQGSSTTPTNLSRAAFEGGQEKSPEPRAAEKKDDGGALSWALNVPVGFVEGGIDLVKDLHRMAFRGNDAKIRQAMQSGNTYVSSTGLGFLDSMKSTGSELGSALLQMGKDPLGTFSAIKDKVSTDYANESSAGQGRMAGKGLFLVATTLPVAGLVGKGFTSLRNLGKGEEVANLARTTRLAGEVTAVGEAAAVGRLVKTGGKLGESTAFLNGVKTADKVADLTTGLRLTETTAARSLSVGSDVGKAGKLETTLARLGKGAEEVSGGAKILGGENVATGTRLTGAVDTSVLGFSKTDQVLRDLDAAARSVMVRTKTAREVGSGAEITGTWRPLVEGGETRAVAGLLDQKSQLLFKPLGETRTALAGLKEGDVVQLAQKTTEVEQWVAKVKLAESAAVREEALAGLRSTVSEYNRLVETTTATAGNPALKISDKLLKDFETVARASSPFKSVGGVELSQAGVKTLDDLEGQPLARIKSGAALPEGQILAKESKAVADAMNAVRMAETDAARQVALREFRAAVGQYNKAVEGNTLTASRAAELRITEEAVTRFESSVGKYAEWAKAGKAEGTGATLITADRAALSFEQKLQGVTSKLDDAKAFTAAQRGEGVLSFEQKTTQVESALQRLRTAEGAVAREQAIADFRASVKQYNKLAETMNRPALQIADNAVTDAEKAARELAAARNAARVESATLSFEKNASALSQQVKRGRTAAEGSEGYAAVSQQTQKVEQSLANLRTAQGTVAREQALAELRANAAAYNKAIEANPLTATRAAELKIGEGALTQFENGMRDLRYARTVERTEAAVTEATIAFDRRAQAVVDQLNKGQALAVATGGEKTAALQQKATEIEEGLKFARAARGPSDHTWAMHELRDNVRAYNELIAKHSATTARARELQIGERELEELIAASRQAHWARRAAEVDVGLAGSHLSRLAGKVDFMPGAMEQAGLGKRPLGVQAQGLAEVATETGRLRSGLRRLEGVVDKAWDAVFTNRLRDLGMTPYWARFVSQGAQGLLFTGAGLGIAWRNLDVVSRGINQAVAEEKTEQMGRPEVAGETGPGRGESARQREAAEAGPAQRDKAAASGEAAREGKAAPEGKREGAPAGGDWRGQRSETGQGAARSSQDEYVMSPAVHALRTPGSQAVPQIKATTAAYIERQEREEKERKKRLNIHDQDWYGPVPIYRKGAEAPVVTESQTAAPTQQPRKFGGNEPDVPRIVSPTFKPQIIYATQAELFGQKGAGRPSEAQPASAVGPASARRVRPTVLQDEDALVKRYPFLKVTGKAAGEAGISSGSRTVFKLAGVEQQERRNMGKPSGSTSTGQAPVAAKQAEPGAPTGGSQDPSKQDEESPSLAAQV